MNELEIRETLFYRIAGPVFFGLVVYLIFEHGREIWDEGNLWIKFGIVLVPLSLPYLFAESWIRKFKLDERGINYRNFWGQSSFHTYQEISEVRTMGDGRLEVHFLDGSHVEFFKNEAPKVRNWLKGRIE
jgi:hypothetical protein